MKLYFIFTRRRLALLFALALLALLMLFRVGAVGIGEQSGKTNAERLYFISSLGLKGVREECTKKQITIPASFDGVMDSYNELQKSAGFDLSKFAGSALTMYTYELENGLGAVHIITDGENIVGGDIADYSVSGDMYPLKKQEKKDEQTTSG